MDGDEQELNKIEVTIKDLQKKHEGIMIKVYNCTNSVFTDQTGQFPITSSRRNKYIMVLCEIDGNIINHHGGTNDEPQGCWPHRDTAETHQSIEGTKNLSQNAISRQ
jgi:hypothetical protein